MTLHVRGRRCCDTGGGTIGASIWFEGLRGHAAVASAHPNVRRSLPVDAAAIAKTLQFADVVLLVGARFLRMSGTRQVCHLRRMPGSYKLKSPQRDWAGTSPWMPVPWVLCSPP